MHYGINLHSLYGNCWRCGGHGLAFALSKSTGRASYPEIVKALGKAAPIGKAENTHEGVYTPPRGVCEMLPAHRNYLKQRHFDPDKIARLWDVEGIGIASKLQWRLFIPIIENGVRISWTTRTIGDSKTRYVSASLAEEALPHGQALYGLDYVRNACIIVEGPTDVWRLGPGTVGTFGTAFNNQQIRRLAKIPVRAICFDRAATAEAERLCDRLSIFPGDTYVVELDSEDPGDANFREIRKIRDLVLKD